ncbi:GspH/FimT family pseudopilin [Tepidiphilus sp. J10]|uniref:GspH/FimT family pseudopilin n=1 Tax=Tepidiphilus sp. J10 TaxID=2502185 RepID=UPI00163DBD3D|nr:GspH/FimT family pseudopilin [Tepidiphilus sp. J10]
MHQPCRDDSGFTLVELMVTIVVLAILLAIGIPSFATLIASNRLTSATNELIASLQTARTEALRRNARVTVCPADPTATACSGAWRDGWMAFVDQTPGNAPAPESAADILFRGGPLPTGIVVVANAPLSSYVSFTADGMSKQLNGDFFPDTSTLRVCSTSTALTDDRRARELRLIGSGRIVLTTPSTSVPSTCPSP